MMSKSRLQSQSFEVCRYIDMCVCVRIRIPHDACQIRPGYFRHRSHCKTSTHNVANSSPVPLSFRSRPSIVALPPCPVALSPPTPPILSLPLQPLAVLNSQPRPRQRRHSLASPAPVCYRHQARHSQRPHHPLASTSAPSPCAHPPPPRRARGRYGNSPPCR